jgi:hypothetical protein
VENPRSLGDQTVVDNSTITGIVQPVPFSVISGRSLGFCGNSFCLVDDLQFVLERQRPPTAVGAIDNQIVITSHGAWEKKPLNSHRFEFAGEFHGIG